MNQPMLRKAAIVLFLFMALLMVAKGFLGQTACFLIALAFVLLAMELEKQS